VSGPEITDHFLGIGFPVFDLFPFLFVLIIILTVRTVDFQDVTLGQVKIRKVDGNIPGIGPMKLLLLYHTFNTLIRVLGFELLDNFFSNLYYRIETGGG